MHAKSSLRKHMAEINIMRNAYDDEAKQVWREYLNSMKGK